MAGGLVKVVLISAGLFLFIQATGVEWQLVDANRSIESIQDEIKQIASSVVGTVKMTEVSPLWPRKKE